MASGKASSRGSSRLQQGSKTCATNAPPQPTAAPCAHTPCSTHPCVMHCLLRACCARCVHKLHKCIAFALRLATLLHLSKPVGCRREAARQASNLRASRAAVPVRHSSTWPKPLTRLRSPRPLPQLTAGRTRQSLGRSDSGQGSSPQPHMSHWPARPQRRPGSPQQCLAQRRCQRRPRCGG